MFRWLRSIVCKERTGVVLPGPWNDQTPWLTVAKKELGVHEIPGVNSEKRIEEYHWSTGTFYSDDVSWCASFLGWCLEQTGYKSSGSPAARSYLSYGEELKEPRLGCIVVFWRGSRNSWNGHVGFYIGDAGDSVIVLGGNQSDKVCEAQYSKEMVLGYRWPVKETVA